MSVLYIHVPKTGGTSVKAALATTPAAITESSDIIKHHPLYDKFHLAVMNFKMPNCVRFKLILGKEKWDSMWKVAFVRNPWDRYVSNWKWLTRKEGLYPAKGWRARGWEGEDGTISFENFIQQMEWCYNDLPKLHGYQHDKWHLRNQIEHLVDENQNIIVDHVARFEDMENEFATICEKLNVKLDLPYLNHTGHYSGEVKDHDPQKTHYSAYYTQELIDIVAAKCKGDIEAFNYDYENKK